MNTDGTPASLCAWCIAALILGLIVVPLGWLGGGWWALARGRPKILRVVGIYGLGLFGLYAAALAWGVWRIGPWRSGVVAHGFGAEGREFCVVQTYKAIVEPFQVSLYERRPGEQWRWHYLEHEDVGWRSATVTFQDGRARVTRNGAPFTEIALAAGSLGTETATTAETISCPAHYSVEQVRAFHDDYFGGRRR